MYKKNPTMRDVAARAGVSVSTVSHVVNRTRHVEPETRDSILSAIDALDYRPNQFARSLKGKASKTIGLIISDIREDFFAEVTKAVESAASSGGYTVILCDSEEDAAKEALYLDMLSSKSVDGIIIAPVDSSAAPRLDEARSVPIVQVDRRCDGAPYDFVGIDNEGEARGATKRLLDRGAAPVGFVGYVDSISTMRERIEGFRGALEERGLFDPRLVLALDAVGSGRAEAVRAWLEAVPGIRGLVCGNADLCYAALEALDAAGSRVPEDVAVATFDDPKWFRFLRCPISALRQPTGRIGTVAFEILARRIEEGGPAVPETVELPAEPVVRGEPDA